ncbi:EAL domain-containing protein [Roseibium sp. MMSF_3412]|uniref:EAL domain-containing protein n=1 Tax=Roseibium sp. MMSF_3412 TaxID=3046712 RepID=UPI0027400472|nr:EAL domain-containing protein [Roseibium sp. MMSF_3412]
MHANINPPQDTGPDSSLTELRSADACCNQVDFELQPIADIGTGVVYGYDAQPQIADGTTTGTFEMMTEIAFERGFLAELNVLLFEKVLSSFKKLRIAQGTKLFFKLDGRDLGQQPHPGSVFAAKVADAGLKTHQICFAFSERYRHTVADGVDVAVDDLRDAGFMIALVEFGQASSELRMLHDLSPDYVKIDRFFLANVDSDPRRKLFVTTVANLAHVLGARVIAQGTETEREFKACRDIGCDLVQGAFVAAPISRPASVKLFYDHLRRPDSGLNRRSEQDRIRGELIQLPTISLQASMGELLDMVVHNQEGNAIPVVDDNQEPRGFVHERDLKKYLYSGTNTDEKPHLDPDAPIRPFVRACPIADINSNADMLLVTFASSINSDGIILTENFHYAGFLSATSLLKIIHEKRLQEAQDQNPLSRLPGNSAVTRYIAEAARKGSHERHLCYLDFDNFKPFNDTYGYKQGDRAIILFSELLQRHVSGTGTFHGHIGGDDFFAGFQQMDQTDVAARMLALKRAFRDDVESFYEPVHREQGYMEAQDRFGTTRQFPLLQCSISILSLSRGLTLRPDALNDEISSLKLAAKRSDDGIVVRSLAA